MLPAPIFEGCCVTVLTLTFAPADMLSDVAQNRKARFLYLVATHSGYFTLRQFNSFAGVHRGKRSMAFAQKLLKHGHATMRDYLGTGSVFHLFSRLLYGPIEKDNVRNRRRHSFDYIRTRLVQMDFLLENPSHDFLETESEKINFFCEVLAVSKDALPAKVPAPEPKLNCVIPMPGSRLEFMGTSLAIRNVPQSRRWRTFWPQVAPNLSSRVN